MLLSARETADRLGIKLDTLYAYVSRGLLRSVEIADSRERHYDADTVDRFRAGRGSRGHAPAETLVPVIGSAICLIENHRLYYRGEDAIALAATPTLSLRAGRGRDPRRRRGRVRGSLGSVSSSAARFGSRN